MPENDDSILYLIAITLIPGIGNTNAKKLISWVDDPELIFKQSRREIMKIPGMPKILRQGVNFKDLLLRAEKELTFIRNNKISTPWSIDAVLKLRPTSNSDNFTTLFICCIRSVNIVSNISTPKLISKENNCTIGFHFRNEVIR